MTQTVNTIAVANQGGFDLRFCVEWAGHSTPWTSYYPVDKTESIDLTLYNIPDNASVNPKIEASGGVTKNGQAVTYVSSPSNTATYTVTGACDTFKVELQ